MGCARILLALLLGGATIASLDGLAGAPPPLLLLPLLLAGLLIGAGLLRLVRR